MRQTETNPVAERLTLTVDELARLLGCSSRSIWKWASEGTFPKPIRLGGSRAVRWIRADVEAHLAAQKVTAGLDGVRQQ